MADYNTIAQTNKYIVLDRYQRTSEANEDYQSEDALEHELISDLVAQGYDYAKHIRTPEMMLTNARVQLESLNDVQFSDDEWQRFLERYLDPASHATLVRRPPVQR